MQSLKLCVWVIFIFGQPQQIVRGYAIEIRQRRDRKRADILVVIGFIFSQCRFGQTGLLRQLFQRQVALLAQVLKPFRDRQLYLHPKSPPDIAFSIIFIITRFHKRGNIRILSAFPTFWIYGNGPLFL